MGSSRFVPLVIAGFIGLLIGWLLGPDVDDIETALGERLTQIEAKVNAGIVSTAGVQNSLAGLDQRLAAVVASTPASAAPNEALAALSTKLDQADAAGKAAMDALGQSVAALGQKIDSLAAAPAAPAGGGDFAALASGLGNSGAILLAGQSAIFGSKTLTVASVEAGTATIGTEGAAPAAVATGSSVDLGEGCSVTLKGVAGPAALLTPAGCGASGATAAAVTAPVAPAAAPAPAAPVPAAPAEAPAAPAETPAPAPAAAAAPAATPAPAAAASASSGSLVIGQTAVFGEKKAFLSRISAADQTAFFFVPGQGQVPGKAGSSVDLGDGCSLTVASVEAGSVSVQPSGCEGAPAGGTAAAAPAPAAEPAPAAAPTPAAEPAAATPAAAPAASTAAGTPIGIGQTATYGDKRIFLSRLTPEAAFIVVVGQGPQEVKPGASADLGGGCSAKLDTIGAGTASFTPTGC